MHYSGNRIRLLVVLALVSGMLAMAFATMATPARANHDTVNWTYTTVVAAETNHQMTWPSFAEDGRGSFYVAYIDYDTVAAAANIQISKYADVGPFGVPSLLFNRQVNDVANVASNSPAPDIAIDHSGNIYVAWTRIDATFGSEVYVSKSSDGGSTWLPAVRANALNAYGTDYWPKITTTPDGSVYVAWIQSWVYTNITVSKSTNGGNTFVGWTNISGDPTLQSASRFDVASDSGGRVYVAFEAFVFALSQSQVFVTHSDGGVAWSTPAPASTSVYSVAPTMAVDGRGRVHLAWAGFYGSIARAYYANSDDRGASWSTAMPIDQGVIPSNFIPTIAVKYDTAMYVSGTSVSGTAGIAYIVSGDRGDSWYPEAVFTPASLSPALTIVGADQNGTFYALYQAASSLYLSLWHSPPSLITNVAVASAGPDSLRVSWSASPEKDVVGYQVWRSVDGSTYALIGTVAPGETSYTDSGLANGTYWYKVIAVDNLGASSHPSLPVSGVVGPTTQELIDQLSAEIAALQSQLGDAQTNLTAVQAQLNALEAQLAALQSSQTANNAATQQQLTNLRQNLTNLQNQLNQARAEQATQTISYVNLGFEILVVVLLALILIMQMRRPKGPQMMMAQPAQTAPPKAEDEL